MRAPFAGRHRRTVDTSRPVGDPSAPEDTAMPTPIDRRTFLARAGTTALVSLAGAPLLAPSRAGAGDRLVVAVGQWGSETPISRRSRQSEKNPSGCRAGPSM